jgi:hypothetical protein
MPEMALQTSTFAYVTDVTLDPLNSPGSLNSSGRAEASVLFLAEHCPHLRSLMFIVKPSWLQEAKKAGRLDGVMGAVQALRVLTVKCGALEVLRLGGIEGLGNPTDEGVAVDLRKADFGGVVLWAWETLRRFSYWEAGEGAVDM